VPALLNNLITNVPDDPLLYTLTELSVNSEVALKTKPVVPSLYVDVPTGAVLPPLKVLLTELVAAKLILAPLQVDAGLAVALVIVGFEFTVTDCVEVKVQPPPVVVRVYVYDPTSVGVIVAGFEVLAVVAPLPVVAHIQLYDNSGEPAVGVVVKVIELFKQMLAELVSKEKPTTFKNAGLEVTEEQGEDPLTITRY
jgi:hypothetical protein